MTDSSLSIYKRNNQTDIVKNDRDSSINILSTLDKEQLAKCKRIQIQALGIHRDLHFFLGGKDTDFSDEDRMRMATAVPEEKPTSYLKKDGKIEVSFLNESYSKKTRSKKNKAYEDPQIATDNLVDNLKNEKRVIEDYFAGERPGEKDQDTIKYILNEEATNYSTIEDITSILKLYLISLNQRIEVLNKSSIEADYRKYIHETLTRKRNEKSLDEHTLAISLAMCGKVPTLEDAVQLVLESENDTKTKELLALNQYEGNVEELIEVFVISQSEPVIDARTDKIQMMLVPIDADIEECVAVQGYKLYLHPAFEESQNEYALTAFSPINGLPVDISMDADGVLSTDGFNGYSSTNPNNNLLLERARLLPVGNSNDGGNVKLLPDGGSNVKLLPAADSDDDSDNSLDIVLADKSDSSTLDIIPVPESVSILDALDTDKEVLNLTLTSPGEILSAIIIEDDLEKRNKNGYTTNSSGEIVFRSSCKDLASKVIRNTTDIIEPLFSGQLVEGDSSHFNYVNNVTRVFLDSTSETRTYKGLVKLRKFATNEEIAIDEAKVLKARIENAPNIAEVTQYDGPSLQSLKNDYQLTVADAEDIIRTYWNIEQNNKIRANNTILSDEEYETYRESKSYGTESNIIRKSDLLSVSESSIKSLKDFLEYAGNDSSSESVAIKELETLLSEISKEQTQILNTPPEEIPDLILAMTNESNEVRDIVAGILQKHYKCDVSVAQEMLALYPAIETVLEIGTSEDEEGNEIFNLPSDIWTNEDYRYEEWNGQRDLLPFPSKQEYKKFIGFIKNIEGNEDGLESASSMLMWKLESVLDLMASNDLEAVKELQTEIDNAAVAKARRKIKVKEMESESLSKDDLVSEEMESTLEDATQELLDIDIYLDNDIQNDSEGELDDVGFIDPSLNISSKDLEILEDILQNKLNNQRLPLRHKIFYKNHFKSIPYEQVDAETISKKIEKARKLLHRS